MGSLMMSTCRLAAEVLGQVGLVPESAVVGLRPGSVWVGPDPESVGATQVLGTTAVGLANGPVGASWCRGGPDTGVCSEVVYSLHSPSSTRRVPLSVLGCAILVSGRDNAFPIVFSVSFLTFVFYPAAASSHVESLVLVKIFSFMDSCSKVDVSVRGLALEIPLSPSC